VIAAIMLVYALSAALLLVVAVAIIYPLPAARTVDSAIAILAIVLVEVVKIRSAYPAMLAHIHLGVLLRLVSLALQENTLKMAPAHVYLAHLVCLGQAAIYLLPALDPVKQESTLLVEPVRARLATQGSIV
jgi:hypothetical protein